MSKPPGPMCVTKPGLSWIDEGANARTQYCAPGPVGIYPASDAFQNDKSTRSGPRADTNGPLGMLMRLTLSATPRIALGKTPTACKTLNSLREIQNYNYPNPTPSATAPDLCLAAASFVAAKLTGLVKTTEHLNGFLSSSAAKGSRASLRFAWGHLNNLAELNSIVLPAAIKWGGLRANIDVEFVHLWSDTAKADALLLAQVPLVVGVSLKHISYSSREHFILLVADSGGAPFAVDSWGETGVDSAVSIPTPFSFGKRSEVTINAGQAIVPCGTPFFGYFREKKSRIPLKNVVAL